MMIWMPIALTFLLIFWLLYRLFLTRAEESSPPPLSVTQRVELVPLFDQWVAGLQPLADKKNVSVTLEFDLIFDSVEINATALRQITRALLQNILYTMRSGSVEILVYQVAAPPAEERITLAIEVTDNGSPLSAKAAAARVERTVSRCQPLVSIIEGTIRGESASAQGVTIGVYLPVQPYTLPSHSTPDTMPPVKETSQNLSGLLFEKDPAAFLHLTRAVITSNDADAQQIRRAVAEKNRNVLAQLAHRQIGGARMMNDVLLEQACLNMQSAVKAAVPDWQQIAHEAAHVEQQMHRLARQLDQQATRLRQ